MAVQVALDAIAKVYRMGDIEVHALREVSLEIQDGEFVAVMGTSGSGKSTLMNIIGCLDRPSSGRYLLNGRDVSQLGRNQLAEVRNQQIGFVFQSFNLLRRTSALENVELPLLYGGVTGKERVRRAREALSRVGLADRMDHHPNQMSGGQQQRVAVARAVVGNPSVLVADEPTGNLDSRTSLEIMALFQELGRTGITVLIVTHEPEIAAYAQRVIMMKDGRVTSDECGTPRSAQADLERELQAEAQAPAGAA
ncbi:MAG TPA: ABC transporter ATP-binding protein [Polyangiales bacterium]|nr:ABC transporter ATP-binding protein [Polyangiales bacterium]